jgi:hypothetical protein
MMKVELFDADPMVEVELPSKFEVCARCAGCGVHDCWEGGMTGDELADQSPEFFDDYMAGMYSVKCTVYNGRRVVEVVDRRLAPEHLLRRYDASERERLEYDALAAAERRYGA